MVKSQFVIRQMHIALYNELANQCNYELLCRLIEFPVSFEKKQQQPQRHI